jgi:hypothetical protein
LFTSEASLVIIRLLLNDAYRGPDEVFGRVLGRVFGGCVAAGLSCFSGREGIGDVHANGDSTNENDNWYEKSFSVHD